ncbi:glycerol-3-phosphate acyltransferase [Dehalogenimonas etheniformans]|uniref:Glycerol-3-phosphate acyltransferase n=1 Tax=Dehalogenimonas etheniformans TaxID=1536648 RepID=A0A2P5PA86_9CHLR|nr:glycerol-3-phosphate acyltransferase [Dehalogenimonas etheniformans]PPD59202.1 glycerol-3-phosphate acyltransferase [Dehalogenimonas etheniformans]QNT75755.1 glycerol-3-phosphate acyltransferase [Dehalogenimonas etheniformans]
MIWLIIASYFIGSFPTAYLTGRLLGRPDIMTLGDGNGGSQNVARSYGFKYGLMVFIIDSLKGALVIGLASSLVGTLSAMLWAGTVCVLGHTWSVFLGFRGGRGEATAIGVLTTLIPLPMIIAGTFAVGTLIWTKSVIKTSIVMFAPLSPLCWYTGVSKQLTIYSMTLPVILGIIYLIKERQRLAGIVPEPCPETEQPDKKDANSDSF